MERSSTSVIIGMVQGVIQILSSAFKRQYAHVNGLSREHISLPTFARALFTVGLHSPRRFFFRGGRDVLRAIGRTVSAVADLRVENGDLLLASDYQHKEQTEKALSTYWLGMAFTKIAAERKLSVPWLGHVDELVRKQVMRLDHDSRERGDLAGRDAMGQWHVIEAKGRSGNPKKGLREAAKRQASRVQLANGTKPHTSSACVVSLGQRPILVELLDPESTGEPDGVTWFIDDDLFIDYYYRDIRDILTEGDVESETIRETSFRVRRLQLEDRTIWVGAPLALCEDDSRERDSVLDTLGAEMVADDVTSVGPDGILLRLGNRETKGTD